MCSAERLEVYTAMKMCQQGQLQQIKFLQIIVCVGLLEEMRYCEICLQCCLGTCMLTKQVGSTGEGHCDQLSWLYSSLSSQEQCCKRGVVLCLHPLVCQGDVL